MVYIAIPAHNNREELLNLLGCLNRQSYDDIQVVVIDDGSTDGTEDEVTLAFPDVTVLKGDGSLWWTGASVLGVTHILQNAKSGDFVLLLNNDLVIDDDYVKDLIDTSLQFDRALVGSTVVDFSDHNRLAAAVRLDNKLNVIVNRDASIINHSDVDTNVDVLSGRGTFIPVEVFEKIGSFNQKQLPHYGADYEFSIRAKIAGFKLVTSHRARVYAKLHISGFDIIPGRGLISLRECFILLFSKKSKLNIRYFLNYVWLCSSNEFKLPNTLRSAASIIAQTFLRTIPGRPFYYVLKLLFKFYSYVKQRLYVLTMRAPE